MVLCNLSVINKTAKFLNCTAVKCSTNVSGEPCLQVDKKQTLCGFATVLERIILGSKSSYCPITIEETALLKQWLEYCICVTNYCDLQPSALDDLNKILSIKNFFIGNRITVVDVIFYYVLHPILASMSFQDKEKFSHLSRWFSTVQHCDGARGDLKLLVFSRNRLY